jgi:hypothetical protein
MATFYVRFRQMKLIFLFIAIISLSSRGTATEISGVVKSEDGKPLSGVQILTYAPAGPADILGMHVTTSTQRYEVSTKPDGSFSIPSHGQLVYFHRADLRPLTKIVDLATKRIEVMMEEVTRTLWKVPACSATNKSNRVGVGFMVTVPENVMVKKDDGRFEDGGYLFGYRRGKQVEVLINWWGSTSLEPEDKYLLESREFSQRMWVSGEKWGYEFRGTMLDGKAWRRIAIRNGAITYQGNTKEAAKVFDWMIDEMCFDESAVKW